MKLCPSCTFENGGAANCCVSCSHKFEHYASYQGYRPKPLGKTIFDTIQKEIDDIKLIRERENELAK